MRLVNPPFGGTVLQAHWEDTERVFGPCNDWVHTITCSHCGSEYDFRGKYPEFCPNCEARMIKEVD